MSSANRVVCPTSSPDRFYPVPNPLTDLTAPSTPSSPWRAMGGLVLLLVILDQVTKILVQFSMDLYQSIPVVGDFVRLTYIRNPGGAFGLRWGHVSVYYVAAFIVIGWIVWHIWREAHTRRLSIWALTLILAGAIGNLIDRVLYGDVVDFIDVEFFDLTVPAFNFGILNHEGMAMDRWPTFNVADSAVTVGVVCLLISLVWDPVVFRSSSAERALSGPPTAPRVDELSSVHPAPNEAEEL